MSENGPASPSRAWQNRIVGHGEEDPRDLVANPRNWRIHPRRQQQALRSAISEVGFIRSVTINRRTGYVLDGHLRVLLALRDEEPGIPVEYVDLSETEEAVAIATLDPLGEAAARDDEQLATVLDDLDVADEDLRAFVLELRDDLKIAAPPDEFPSYDDDIETEHECPRCGFRWS